MKIFGGNHRFVPHLLLLVAKTPSVTKSGHEQSIDSGEGRPVNNVGSSHCLDLKFTPVNVVCEIPLSQVTKSLCTTSSYDAFNARTYDGGHTKHVPGGCHTPEKCPSNRLVLSTLRMQVMRCIDHRPSLPSYRRLRLTKKILPNDGETQSGQKPRAVGCWWYFCL